MQKKMWWKKTFIRFHVFGIQLPMTCQTIIFRTPNEYHTTRPNDHIIFWRLWRTYNFIRSFGQPVLTTRAHPQQDRRPTLITVASMPELVDHNCHHCKPSTHVQSYIDHFLNLEENSDNYIWLPGLPLNKGND